MSETPKLSVGMPIRNGAAFVRTAVDSILCQDFSDLELILSDNASDDQTAELCRWYVARDARVRYHRFHENQGAARNYNQVFQMSRAPYFKWAAHDDVCLPGMLQRCVDVLDRAPESVVLVYPKIEIIDAAGRVTGRDTTSLEARQTTPSGRFIHLLRNMNLASPLFGILRADALRKTRLIDSFVGSDYVLLAELSLLGQIWELPDILFQRRIHPGTSRRVNATQRSALAWFDPRRAAGGDRLSVDARLMIEYWRSILGIAIPWRQRVSLLGCAPVIQYWRKFRNWGGLRRRQVRASFAKLRVDGKIKAEPGTPRV